MVGLKVWSSSQLCALGVLGHVHTLETSSEFLKMVRVHLVG
jgi:hypothetical protein